MELVLDKIKGINPRASPGPIGSSLRSPNAVASHGVFTFCSQLHSDVVSEFELHRYAIQKTERDGASRASTNFQQKIMY